MIIAWENLTKYTLISILSFIDDTLDDMVDLRKLNRALKGLEDNHAVIVDFNNGNIGVKAL